MRVLAALIAVLLAPGALADPWRVDSGEARTVLVELFTSEGCSSCPPAEAWLNRFADHPALWRTYVPVARHVGYWDYLGWRDPYAHPDHAQSQHNYARTGALSSVYTPAFVVNGRGWRPGFGGAVPQPPAEAAGRLVLDVDGDTFRAAFDPPSGTATTLRLHLAVLGMGLVSEIRAGENRGRELRHEFVALALQQFDGAGGTWSGRLPQPDPAARPARLALAAWVTRSDDPATLQAVGGYLPAPAAAQP